MTTERLSAPKSASKEMLVRGEAVLGREGEALKLNFNPLKAKQKELGKYLSNTRSFN